MQEAPGTDARSGDLLRDRRRRETAPANPSHRPVNISDPAGQVRRLRGGLLFAVSALDYNASPSPDGQWILFTFERDGSADIYRARMDGSALERLTTDPVYDDQASWSPDGTKVAFVSTRGAGTTDIWTIDLRTKKERNLTMAPGGETSVPAGHPTDAG